MLASFFFFSCNFGKIFEIQPIFRIIFFFPPKLGLQVECPYNQLSDVWQLLLSSSLQTHQTFLCGAPDWHSGLVVKYYVLKCSCLSSGPCCSSPLRLIRKCLYNIQQSYLCLSSEEPRIFPLSQIKKVRQKGERICNSEHIFLSDRRYIAD